MPTVPLAYPVAPPVNALRYRVPVQSAAAGSLIDFTNHLVGWRALRSTLKTWDYDPSVVSGNIINDNPNGTTIEVRATMRLSGIDSAARGIFVVVDYQATKEPSGSAPAIDCYLDNLTDGATARDQITWSVANGTLPTQFTPGGNVRYPILRVTSTIRYDGSASTAEPRLLTLDTAGAGTDGAGDIVQIRLDCTDVRPHRLLAIEAYREQLT